MRRQLDEILVLGRFLRIDVLPRVSGGRWEGAGAGAHILFVVFQLSLDTIEGVACVVVVVIHSTGWLELPRCGLLAIEIVKEPVQLLAQVRGETSPGILCPNKLGEQSTFNADSLKELRNRRSYAFAKKVEKSAKWQVRRLYINGKKEE